MKIQVLSILAIISLMTACTNQGEIETSPASNNQNVSSIRSYSEALKIAQDAIPMLNDKATTRGESCKRKIDLNDKKVFKLNAKTRAQATNDTLIYVFNFENNEGFALVSASKNTEGLLAITGKGYCDPNTRSDIGGFEIFIDLAKKYVTDSKGPGDLVDYKDSLVYATYNYVGPYLTVQWGQAYPEGEFCPNGFAGCTNTAIAQIMSYFQYPASITLTYPERDKNSQSLNWTAMKNHTTGHNFSLCLDTITHNSIGRLHRQLGQWTHSSYYTGGPTNSSTMAYAPETFYNLGYSFNTGITNASSIRSELDNTHLLLIRGESPTQDAHAWVIDGYLKFDGTYYEMINDGSGWIFTGAIHYRSLYYNHMNWGWYGTNNGYFLEDVFSTSQGIYWDTTSHDINFYYGLNIWLLSVYH